MKKMPQERICPSNELHNSSIHSIQLLVYTDHYALEMVYKTTTRHVRCNKNHKVINTLAYLQQQHALILIGRQFAMNPQWTNQDWSRVLFFHHSIISKIILFVTS